MGRLGFKEDEYHKIINGLENCDHINKITLMTHFSSADNHDSGFTEVQIDKFNNIVGNKQNDQSLANSAAIMAWNNSHSAYTRPGIMLYGSSPFPFNEPPTFTLDLESGRVFNPKSLLCGFSTSFLRRL